MDYHLDPLCPHEVGWTPDHHREPATNFDFDEVDRRLGWAPKARPVRRVEVVRAAGAALHSILAYLVAVPGGRFNPSIVGRKTLALSFVLGHSALQGRSLTYIAAQCGVSKQCLSKLATGISRQWNLPSRGMKSFASRESYREANTGAKHWRARKAALKKAAKRS